MRKQVLKSDSLLLITALIWGTTFVAQRTAMDHIGPMTFIGVRFVIGALTVLPFALKFRPAYFAPATPATGRFLLCGGILAGLALFGGASFQQIGLQYTTAGKAGFITCLYVVIVPLIGLLLGHRCGLFVWIGAALAVIGLYLLSVTESFTIARGDLLVLVGAFFWAVHVLLIDYLAKRAHCLRIACIQFATCSVLGLAVAMFTEQISLSATCRAAVPILYAGILSTGIAFTLQIVCQRISPPAHAAIIMSMETVFAALAGWVVLSEILDARDLAGCAIMLLGLIAVQIAPPPNAPASPGQS